LGIQNTGGIRHTRQSIIVHRESDDYRGANVAHHAGRNVVHRARRSVVRHTGKSIIYHGESADYRSASIIHHGGREGGDCGGKSVGYR
jgi:hypothetical protein